MVSYTLYLQPDISEHTPALNPVIKACTLIYLSWRDGRLS